MAMALPLPLPHLDAAATARACGSLERLYQHANLIHGRGVRVPSTFPAAELAWLTAHGLAPNQRTTIDHDALVARVRGARRIRTLAAGAAAFTASLTGGLPHGVFLEAALLAHRLPAHAFTPLGRASTTCTICGLPARHTADRAEEFLSWHDAGTGIPGDLAWAARALTEWPRGAAARPTPAARARLAQLLLAIERVPATGRPGAAVAAVHALGGFGGRRDHRARGVVETLAFAGVLEAPPHVGLATAFVSYVERDRRPTVRTEFDAPLGFWRGAHGVQWRNVERLFGIDRAAAAKLAATAPAPAPAARAPRARTKVAAPRAPRGLPRRPARAGDVWSVRLREDAWIAAYVWEVAPRGDRPYARVEYLDRFTATPPTAAEVAGAGVRGRRDGRWQTWASGLHTTTGLALVAEGAAPPPVTSAAPDRVPAGGGKDLIHLADWCFPELDAL